tara:strand:- start:2558 stop:2845 length:288 start_codon:yes stop_codon:yes gene_type:complete
MGTDQIIQAAVTAASILAFTVPALIKLGIRFQALQGEIGGLRLQMVSIEKDLAEFKVGLSEARTAREKLWTEINAVRDRTTRLSTVMALKEEKCQ